MTATKIDLRHFWMPYTNQGHFKQHPRIFTSAKGMYFQTDDGRTVLDGTGGLWCVHCGHSHPQIVAAIAEQAGELDFGPTFQMGHPKVFELATKLASEVFPGKLNSVFFANSGSEAVDTALKIALAYHILRGEPQRTLLVGRQRGYHGVNFGGTAVGGIALNRKWFPNQMRTEHIRHTHDLERNAFSRGLPKHGAERADDLANLFTTNDPSTIAAVIVEPVAGSTGVLLPPEGYLARLREICSAHGILLIFDEVITGFGRVGHATASAAFGVEPDMLTFAKGVNSGSVPLGGVAVNEDIYAAFIDQASGKMIDTFHGYTYTGHPLAMAAGLAAQQVYQDEGLFERPVKLASKFEEGIHALRGLPHVIDIRNYGFVGAVELQPREGAPTTRAYEVFCEAFHNEDLLVRTTGDIIAISPPLIASEEELGEIFARLGNVLKRVP